MKKYLLKTRYPLTDILWLTPALYYIIILFAPIILMLKVSVKKEKQFLRYNELSGSVLAGWNAKRNEMGE